MFVEGGRFWSEKIFEAIKFLAFKYKITPTSCLGGNCNKLSDIHEMFDVLDTCEICLGRLTRQVFFGEEATASSGMTQPLKDYIYSV